MDPKVILAKLKNPAFYCLLIGLIANELSPMLEAGQSVNIASILKIVGVAFMGLMADTPKVKKPDVLPPSA